MERGRGFFQIFFNLRNKGLFVFYLKADSVIFYLVLLVKHFITELKSLIRNLTVFDTYTQRKSGEH